MDKEQRKVIFISDNKHLFRAVQRAFRLIDGIKYTHILTCPDAVQENNVILLDAVAREMGQSAIISLRLRMNLCPIIVLTAYDPEKEKNIYKGTAITYYPIPFDLWDVRQSVKYSSPISKGENIDELLVWLGDAFHYIEHKIRRPEGRAQVGVFLDTIITSFKQILDSALKQEISNINKALADPGADTRELTSAIIKMTNDLKRIISEKDGKRA